VTARNAAIKNRTALAVARSNLRSIRSTIPPIGIAKRSQGSITTAARIEITTGSLVSVAAKSKEEVLNSPSAKLLAKDDDQSLLKAGPRDSVVAFGVDIRASTLAQR
jgi:hypothetical protein